MPVKVTNLGNGGVFITGTGTVSGKDILEINNSIYATPEMIKQIRFQLCDYTDVDNWQISSGEVRMLSERDKHAAEVNPTMIIAIAGKQNETFGLSRMWKSYSDISTLRTHVFRTIEECEEWIKSQLDI